MPIHTQGSVAEEEDLVSISPPQRFQSLSSDVAVKQEHEHGHGHEEEHEQVEHAEHAEHAHAVDDKAERKRLEEELQRKMDETVKRVREQSDRLQAAATPYARRTRDFAEQRPVLFTFLAIFMALSFIPIACFAGFVLASTAFILGIAIIGIVIAVLGTILFASSILLPVLLFTTILSASCLAFLLCLFLLHRLYLHLTISLSSSTIYDGSPNGDVGRYEYNYANVSRGVQGWIDETKGRVGLEGVPLVPRQLKGVGSRIRWAQDNVVGGEKGEGKWIIKREDDGDDTDATQTDGTPRPRPKAREVLEVTRF